jgi:hypothetical protein
MLVILSTGAWVTFVQIFQPSSLTKFYFVHVRLQKLYVRRILHNAVTFLGILTEGDELLAIKTCQRESETRLYRKTIRRELLVAQLAE